MSIVIIILKCTRVLNLSQFWEHDIEEQKLSKNVKEQNTKKCQDRNQQMKMYFYAKFWWICRTTDFEIEFTFRKVNEKKLRNNIKFQSIWRPPDFGTNMPIKANEKNRQIVMHHCAKFEYHQIFTPHMPKATECHIKIVIRMIQFTTVLSFIQFGEYSKFATLFAQKTRQ